MLTRRGMNPQVWQATPDVAPTVFAEKLVPGAKRTILFYIHFDGQPVDRARWKRFSCGRDSSAFRGYFVFAGAGAALSQASPPPSFPATEYKAPGALRVFWNSSSVWPRMAA